MGGCQKELGTNFNGTLVSLVTLKVFPPLEKRYKNVILLVSTNQLENFFFQTIGTIEEQNPFSCSSSQPI